MQAHSFPEPDLETSKGFALMTPEIAERVKETLTDLVAQDGGAVELLQYSNDSIEFNLLLSDVKCAECVMPSHFLEQIILDK